MNALIRPASVVAAAVLLAVWFFGSHFACDPKDLREIIRGVRHGQELDQLQRATSHRHEQKENAVQELIAQRFSLSEALERLEELDREWIQELERDFPDCTREMRKFLTQIWSDPEYHYGRITDRVNDLLSDRREEKEAVLSRLEKDYQLLRDCQQTFSSAPMERSGPSLPECDLQR